MVGGERCHSSALLPQKCTFTLLCKKETDRFSILSHLCSKNLCFHIFWIGGFGGLGVWGDCRIGSIGPSVHGGRITPKPVQTAYNIPHNVQCTPKPPKPVHRNANCIPQTTQCTKHTKPTSQCIAAHCILHTACCIPQKHSNANYK